jgi:hypothetical protein
MEVAMPRGLPALQTWSATDDGFQGLTTRSFFNNPDGFCEFMDHM